MSAEAFAPLLESLLAAGAKDAFLTPILMKKTRPGTRLTVLCDETLRDRLLSVVFEQSTSIGVRVLPVEKFMLPRQQRTVSTSLGDIDVKEVALANGTSRWKLEHDQVNELAQNAGRDYLSVHTQLHQEVTEALDNNQPQTDTP